MGGVEPTSALLGAKDKAGPSSDNETTLETSNKLVYEGILSDNSGVSQVPAVRSALCYQQTGGIIVARYFL